MLQGDRIKIAREAKQMTQQELANNLKISQALLQSYESNKKGLKNPNILLLFRICAELEISIEWLLIGDKTSVTIADKKSELTFRKFTFYAIIIEKNDIEIWTTSGDVKMIKKKGRMPVSNNLGKLSYVLIIEDDDFTYTGSNESTISFKKGDCLVVDPGLKPSDGDFVIAKDRESSCNFILRKYTVINGNAYLEALNKKVESVKVNNNYNFYGVVREVSTSTKIK